VITSNLDPIFHRLRDTVTYRLKFFIENCGRTAADLDRSRLSYYWQLI